MSVTTSHRILAALALACAACATPPPAPAPATAEIAPPTPPPPPARTLTLLHISDTESELLPQPLTADGGSAGGIGRATRLAAALRARAEGPVLLVASGDLMIPAPTLQVELDGKNAVATGSNLMGYAASAVGNHEFDLGDGFLADMIAAAKYPYLASNLDPVAGPLDELDVEAGDVGANAPWAEESPGKILSRAKACAGKLVAEGETRRCDGLVVGLVGATTETLRSITSASDGVRVTPTLEALRDRLQAQVDLLEKEGIDVVVALTHLQGIEHELALVDLGLTGVDVIVGGGGDDRLADAKHRLLAGDRPDPSCAHAKGACYPMRRAGKDGKPLLVVATDGHYRYLGRLGVTFDEAGAIASVDEGSKPWPIDDASLAEAGAASGGDGAALEAKVAAVIEPHGKPFARTAAFLNGLREQVRNRETNLGTLSADARLGAAGGPARGPRPRFALRTGGAGRAGIGAVDPKSLTLVGGPIAPLDVMSAFRFDNELVVVRTTHEVLVETLEAALRDAGTSRGRFPQVSDGVRLVYRAAGADQVQKLGPDGAVLGVTTPGSRVLELVVPDAAGKPVTVVKGGKLLAPRRTVDFVALSYNARGGDGWFPGRTAGLPIEPLGVREQEAFTGFVRFLEREKKWKDGAGYPDPDPARPESFTRVVRQP